MDNKTCFKSLAYCCALSKPCKSRDNEIERKEITKKDYVKLKKMFDENLKKLAKKNEKKK
ncbi:hypothetical protein COV15_03305 [Candidatus Woesearchaeota archaeon CG10_big_fil_rev_8_21_14_0_10_34_12]|nr:MAG: hypothetical protein COV15_03305 [Candidatus Woesearchaeota archaeon CG10_big_fil_rev_8_21_14_0_10_34_12]